MPMFRIRFPLFLLCSALLAAACAVPGGPTGSPAGSPSGGPSGGPSPTPSALRIDHKTAATDLILRYQVGGGFVAPGFLLTEKPVFSLYGDGTAIFQESAEPTAPQDGILRLQRLKIVRLPEDQVQDLLEFAIGPGGLGLARASYEEATVADAPTTTFELHAGGLDKIVSAYALGFEAQPGPDSAARRALQMLADRLAGIDSPSLGARIYEPERYRAYLQTADVPIPGVQPIAWPWPSLTPDDFKPAGDPNAPDFPRRVLTADEVAALKLGEIFGGATGIQLRVHNGNGIYTLTLRPLLPDEQS